MKQAIAAVLILLAWTGSARAWSKDGHRIVCAIAWKELAPETRALVEDLLEEDLDEDYVAQNAPEVAKQLRKAGVRLAWSLQAALGQPLEETDDS